VQDRCTRSHEYLFHLTKNPHYFYDTDAIREPFTDGRLGADGSRSESERGGRTDGFTKPNGIDPSANGGRNKRTVWTVNPKPYSGAHFAVWPEALVEPMIKAGSSEKGACKACGASWVRVTDRSGSTWAERKMAGYPTEIKGNPEALLKQRSVRLGGSATTTTGWEATCGCDADLTRCIVMDIFSGSATTGAVALRLGRDYIGLDLSHSYLDLAVARLEGRSAPNKKDEAQQAMTNNILDLFES
jgi:hypothetical protein